MAHGSVDREVRKKENNFDVKISQFALEVLIKERAKNRNWLAQMTDRVAVDQTSLNWGHDLTIIDEASKTRSSPKPSRGRVIKSML